MSRLRRLLPTFMWPSMRLFSFACNLLRYCTDVPQEPSVEDVRLTPIVGGGHMHLTQVDAGDQACRKRTVERRLFVGRDSLVLRAGPVDNDSLGQVPRPGQHERGV